MFDGAGDQSKIRHAARAVALRRMENELAGARRSGQKLFKFVHGYGSTGTGGKIRGAVRRALAGRNEIAWVLPGEDFGPSPLRRGRRHPVGPACGRIVTGAGRMMGSPWWCCGERQL